MGGCSGYMKMLHLLYETWALTNFGIHRVGGDFKMTVLKFLWCLAGSCNKLHFIDQKNEVI